jgi:large subunit ribosomal protein L23
MEQNKYPFEVNSGCQQDRDKARGAVECLKYPVVSVTTMNVKGKMKRMGRYIGKRPDRKKAIVTLKPGDKIEVFEGL